MCENRVKLSCFLKIVFFPPILKPKEKIIIHGGLFGVHALWHKITFVFVLLLCSTHIWLLEISGGPYFILLVLIEK